MRHTFHNKLSDHGNQAMLNDKNDDLNPRTWALRISALISV